MESKKYLKKKIVKQGQPFYLITEVSEGEIVQAFEKPNQKLINDPKMHMSGAHIILCNSGNNHIDHFKNGSKWKEYVDCDLTWIKELR